MTNDVAHALLRAAPRLVSALRQRRNDKGRDESRPGTLKRAPLPGRHCISQTSIVMPISFDFANVLEDVVGLEHGVSRAEIEQNRGTAAAAVHSFRKKSEEGRYGFPHLPFQQKVIDEVRQYAA